VKAVFDVKPRSGYDDETGLRYHFPARRNYLEAARNAVGDWVLFREPQRNGGRRAYIAVARVVGIERDAQRADHCYAAIADYLAFPTPVPFALDGRYREEQLRQITDPNRVGQALHGKSLRTISTTDFDAIVLAGLSETLAPENAVRLGLEFPPFESSTSLHDFGVAETVERRVEEMLVNRKIRDANFRLEVCRAYDNRCAVTGLRIINGGGRAEVQAAHIKPVAMGGPDIVRNGIALSATVHWLFDRHLITIGEDHRLLVAHNRVPAELRRLFRPEDEGLHLPGDRNLWPHPTFLAHHREAFVGVGY